MAVIFVYRMARSTYRIVQSVRCKAESVKGRILTKRTFFVWAVAGSSLGVLRVVSR